MVDQKIYVVKINYHPCDGCDGFLDELGELPEVQRIDRDANKHKASIFVTGDLYKVTEELESRGKRFEYFEQTSAVNKVTKAPKKHGKKFEYLEKSPPMNNQEKRLVKPPKPLQVVPQPPGYGFTGIPLEDLEINKTIVKKTKVCCPKCNHELELKTFYKRFACDGCKEDGFGSRYRCKDCDCSLHQECASPKPVISPDFLQGSAFKFCHQPCSTRARPCYACGRAIRGYFYRCKSKELDLHPYCSNLKRNLYGMDFVHHGKEISSSSKCVCCEKKMPWATKMKNSGSCSYITTCKKYHFHVYCLHKAWKERALNFSAHAMSMPPEKRNNSNRRGGRFGEILTTLGTVAGAIIGFLVGDPTGALGAALGAVLSKFFSIILLKSPSK